MNLLLFDEGNKINSNTDADIRGQVTKNSAEITRLSSKLETLNKVLFDETGKKATLSQKVCKFKISGLRF